jgi:hypothetical protein
VIATAKPNDHEEDRAMSRDQVRRTGRLAWVLVVLAGAALVVVGSVRPRAGEEPGLVLPGFRLGAGGVLEWPGRLRLAHGGLGAGLPPVGGLVRAQPGGNLVLEPQGDFMRSALDLLPSQGKPPDLDAIGELTIHRVHPTRTTQEMISYSALAHKQGLYGIVVEAHGEGRLRPLALMTVQGGLNPGEAPFSAEALRMTEDGTIVLGVHREGGRLRRPVDSLTIEQPPPAGRGTSDSDALAWVGKGHDGQAIHVAHWRAQVRVRSEAADSSLVLTSSVDGRPAAGRFEVTDQGDLELPTPGAGIVLRSPNGKRWRITVDDEGRLQTAPAR